MSTNTEFENIEYIDAEVLKDLRENYKYSETGDMLYPYNHDIGDRC